MLSAQRGSAKTFFPAPTPLLSIVLRCTQARSVAAVRAAFSVLLGPAALAIARIVRGAVTPGQSLLRICQLADR